MKSVLAYVSSSQNAHAGKDNGTRKIMRDKHIGDPLFHAVILMEEAELENIYRQSLQIQALDFLHMTRHDEAINIESRRMFMFRTALLSAIGIALCLSLAACNTIEGMGKDVRAAGETISSTTSRNKTY